MQEEDDDPVPMEPPEAYAILQIPETASVAEIEEAHRQRVSVFHASLNKAWIRELTEAREVAKAHAGSGSGLIFGTPSPAVPYPQPSGSPSPAPEPPQPAPRPTSSTATRPSRPADRRDEWLSAVGEFAEVTVYSYVEIVGSILLVIAGFGLFILLLKAML